MNLLHSLLALWPSDLAFAVTLMFIGQVRVNHHVAFDHIRPADGIVVLLNAVLLMSWRSFRSPPRPCRGAAQRTRPTNRRGLRFPSIRRSRGRSPTRGGWRFALA
jgi:Endosomal/lysosomal potassium channel TMEM175